MEDFKLVKYPYVSAGAKEIEVVKRLGTIGDDDYYLVRFTHHNQKLSSIAMVKKSLGYAEIVETTLKKYEQTLVDNFEDELAFYDDSYDEDGYEITEAEKEEYVIQSDLDNEDYYGAYSADYSSLMDNTDFDRWIDEHRGEIFEH